eukprot:TRINITY_DN13903_c0_g1_i1.p1 TRINITY_DN13903_c0_g1~~TRINITY_DN13903_c0_g1_i1.p1  ORF type:complete len:212 (+),score=28.47 TRINITY_DN13903_c0_g1_i1:37-636(+)
MDALPRRRSLRRETSVVSTSLLFGFLLVLSALGDSLVNGVVLNGTATYYTWPSGGNSCNVNSGMCVAPSDGWDALWTEALGISSKCDYVPPCDYSCDVCCQKPGPGCPYDQLCSANGGSFCVRCIDDSSVCKSYDFVRVQIADACPSDHPCNTCKGDENPCAEGLPHIDLCEEAFFTIALQQITWEGIAIEVSTDLSQC